jgi:hypothetical protein
MKTRRVLVVLLAATALVSVVSVMTHKKNSTVNAEAIKTSDFQLDDETIEQLCDEKGITSSLVYAVRQAGYTVDEKELITKLGEFADLEDEDGEVDIIDAIAEVLGCSEDEAINVIEISDDIQEDNE